MTNCPGGRKPKLETSVDPVPESSVWSVTKIWCAQNTTLPPAAFLPGLTSRELSVSCVDWTVLTVWPIFTAKFVWTATPVRRTELARWLLLGLRYNSALNPVKGAAFPSALRLKRTSVSKSAHAKASQLAISAPSAAMMTRKLRELSSVSDVKTLTASPENPTFSETVFLLTQTPSLRTPPDLSKPLFCYIPSSNTCTLLLDSGACLLLSYPSFSKLWDCFWI